MSSYLEGCTSWWSDCWVRYNKPMTPREYLRLNAWQKWQLFRRPPWKFIINLIIVICATTQVILLNTYFAPFNRANVATWNYLLTPRSNPSGDTYGSMTVYHIYQVPDLVDSVQQTLDVYYGLQNTSVDYFEFFYQQGDPTKPLPVRLTVDTYSQGPAIFDLTSTFRDDVTRKQYLLSSPTDLGPFDEDNKEMREFHELNTYVHYLYKLHLDFEVRNYEFAGERRLCYKWDVNLSYDFSVRGRIDLTLNTNTQLCPEEQRVPWYERALLLEIVMYFLLAFFAAVSQVLHLKAIYRSIIIFQEARLATINSKRAKRKGSVDESLTQTQTHTNGLLLSPSDAVPSDSLNINSHSTGQMNQPLLGDSYQQPSSEAEVPRADDDVHAMTAWSSLSLKDKLRFFNMWFVLATIGNLCNMVGPLLSLRNQVLLQSDPTRLYFLGLGCMMAWINVVQYFEGAASYYVLITTLRKGTPRVCRFLIGVLPVFLGYAMFGVAFFSTASENFATIDSACVTLFALLNGDVVHDIFDDLYPLHPTISRIYLYTFICLFIYAVLNIFIAIIEDAFFASKAFQLHGQPELEDKEKDDQVDPLLLLEFEGMFGDGDKTSSESDDDDVHSSSSSSSSTSSSSSSSSSSSTSSSSSDDSDSDDGKRRYGSSSNLRSLGRGQDAGPTAGSTVITASEVDEAPRSKREKRDKKDKKDKKEKRRERRSRLRDRERHDDHDHDHYDDALLSSSLGGVSQATGKDVDGDYGNSLGNSSYVSSAMRSQIDLDHLPLPDDTHNTPNTRGQPASVPAESTALKSLWPSLNANTNTTTQNTTAAQPTAVSNDFLSVFSQAQSSVNTDFAARFATLLSTPQVNGKPLRPPHSPAYFPCGFADCMYCIIRAATIKTMNEAQQQLQHALSDSQLTTPNNPNTPATEEQS